MSEPWAETHPNYLRLDSGDQIMVEDAGDSIRLTLYVGCTFVGRIVCYEHVGFLHEWLGNWLKRKYNAERPSPKDAFAELRAKFGEHFDKIEDVDAWVREQRSGEDTVSPSE